MPDPNHLLVSVQASMRVRGGWRWWNARFPSYSFLLNELAAATEMGSSHGIGWGGGRGCVKVSGEWAQGKKWGEEGRQDCVEMRLQDPWACSIGPSNFT